MPLLDSPSYDEAANALSWGNGVSTTLYRLPGTYFGGGGGATTEDLDALTLLRPALDALGYSGWIASDASGDSGPSAMWQQATQEGAYDYLRNTYGAGDFAIGSTRLTGSDSDGGYSRRDLFRRGADGTWRAIDGSGFLFGDTGYKSDGRKVGTIIASWLGGVILNGAGAADAGASAGSAAGSAPAAGNGAFLGEGVASGVGAWDAAATTIGLELTTPAVAIGLDAAPIFQDGAFLGENIASGVPAWDAAAINAGLDLTTPVVWTGTVTDAAATAPTTASPDAPADFVTDAPLTGPGSTATPPTAAAGSGLPSLGDLQAWLSKIGAIYKLAQQANAPAPAPAPGAPGAKPATAAPGDTPLYLGLGLLALAVFS